ncbi:osmotically inducible protein C [Bacillus glycinifermentans]|uniref:OsmC family protein n=1 Tax=Bacillus glycinifermentans TaxID=1664069 RepID=A0A0J6ENN7_9BACI|nr:OsmC family protein [Bacillus glycinifermentans]ATH94731.1 osmotically inducible protein C [Bacillus glycinifermentans]KMM58880.1 osmotically inducible protein C [Bacillus glycinifermentans]KRT92015.1 osmotically inducible protein C [Bacillus glycinifermentans]MEC0486457.1 OsmC family protein [Bacillus glycinifermentans]MEC0494107.1 OsmC family protein [Bacillus glycinifermentans]
MEVKSNQNGFYADFEYGRLTVSGHEEEGFRPYQLMVASIAACSGAVFRKILEKKRLQLKSMTIKAKEERVPEEADRLKSIHLHFVLKGERLRPDIMEKALKTAMRNCAMVRSVQGSIDITESFEIIP